MKEDYTKRLIDLVYSIDPKVKWNQKRLLDIYNAIHHNNKMCSGWIEYRISRKRSNIEVVTIPKKWTIEKKAKIEKKVKEVNTTKQYDDYEYIKAMRENKCKWLRYHRSYGEVLILRAYKKKYWLPPRTKVNNLLYHIWKCGNN